MLANINVSEISAFKDNYIWCINNTDKAAIIVDPGDAKPVIEYIKHHSLKPKYLLITHYHFDHIGGIDSLVALYPDLKIYAPNYYDIPHRTDVLTGGETIYLTNNKLKCQVLAVPGHTKDHLAFYFTEEKLLFCGDTLFSGGCGRLECSFEQMYNTLQMLKQLPNDCKIYCAHEYTVANLTFASQYYPEDCYVKQQLKIAQNIRDLNGVTLPSTIATEKKCNIFLKAKTLAEFTAIRIAKDNY